MCLGVPGRILRIGGAEGGLSMGVVQFGSVTRECCLAYVPEAREGDYVIVHVGFAIAVVDPEEAERTLAFLEAMDGPEALEPGGGA